MSWRESMDAQQEQSGPEDLEALLADQAPPLDENTLVTVCDKCLQASCWHGMFMCDASRSAGIVDLPVYRLRELGREHPSYWHKPGHAA